MKKQYMIFVLIVILLLAVGVFLFKNNKRGNQVLAQDVPLPQGAIFVETKKNTYRYDSNGNVIVTWFYNATNGYDDCAPLIEDYKELLSLNDWQAESIEDPGLFKKDERLLQFNIINCNEDAASYPTYTLELTIWYFE